VPCEIGSYDAQPTAANVHDHLTEWAKLPSDTVQAAEALDPSTLPPKQAEAVLHAKELLTTQSAELTTINTLMGDRASYVWRFKYQRQLSRRMFEASWQTLYTDRLALFVGKSYEQVRQMLTRLEHDPLDF